MDEPKVGRAKELFTDMHTLGSKLTHTVTNSSPQYWCMVANLIPVSHLADHSGFGPQSCSLYTLVGSLPSKPNEELVTMDGFPGFG